MRLYEIIEDPQIQALKPSFDTIPADFEKTVDEGLTQALITNLSKEMTKGDIISFVVNFLIKVISDNVKPKRKFWQVVFSVLPAIGNAISGVFSKKK